MTLDLAQASAALPAYEIGSELGRGGWGAVLAGRHRQLDRDVAIKQLPRAFAASPEVRARFVAEAQLLASLDHPHIVGVYDFVDAGGLCLLVMEQLTLGTVWSRFVARGFTLEEACGVVLAACAGLEHAHRQGILHRDVKPENLMFSARGVLKVTDFGIAKMLGGPDHLMTRDGEVLGTPAYIAPEQAQGGELGPATDVYATGVLLYELLCGQLPFPDEGDALALLYRHVHEEPRPIREVAPVVPAALAAVVMRALARDPGDRHPSAEALGVAVAEAVTAACGTGWLARSDMPLMTSGAIQAAVDRPSGGPALTLGASLAPAPAPARAAGARAPSTIVDPPAPRGPDQPVRPSIVVHTRGVVSEGMGGADVVPLRRALPRPRFPWAELAAVAGSVVALAGVALAGWGAPASGGDLADDSLILHQTGPARATTVLDLAEPVRLTGTGVDLRGAELRLIVLGIELGSATAVPETGNEPTAGAEASNVAFDLGDARFLAAGPVTAELTLADGRRHTLVVDSRQPRLLTAPGAVGVAAALFLLAYAESLLRSLRRGRKRASATAGLVAIGSGAGLVALDLVWLAGRSPSTAGVIAGAAVGALTGAALARFGIGLGRRRQRPTGRRS